MADSNCVREGVEWREVLNTGDNTIVYLLVEPK